MSKQKAEGRRQKAEGRRQKAEGRKQKAESRRQKAESRRQKLFIELRKGGSMYGGFRDLKVYQLAYALAMEVFVDTKKFPKEERYSLTDQLWRASRSIPGLIAEAWRKRRYPKSFVLKLTDAWGEQGETEVWLDMSRDCEYLDEERHQYYFLKYEEVGKMLFSMIEQPEKFCY